MSKGKVNIYEYRNVKNKSKRKIAETVRDHSELLMVDSGAHSFQKGKKVSWEEYTKQYAEFIKEFDRKNVLGYFEMDVDNIIGYEKVLRNLIPLKKALDYETISDDYGTSQTQKIRKGTQKVLRACSC